MAKNETTRLKPAQIVTDRDSFSALQNIAYTPSNPAYGTPQGNVMLQTMLQSQNAEAQAEAAFKAARDNATTAEWAFHNFILSAKDQVKALFGPSSNELQSMGLKKKSEYKSPKTKVVKPAAK
jgi:hypothetical protein